jgi:hypothetical protein
MIFAKYLTPNTTPILLGANETMIYDYDSKGNYTANLTNKSEPVIKITGDNAVVRDLVLVAQQGQSGPAIQIANNASNCTIDNVFLIDFPVGIQVLCIADPRTSPTNNVVSNSALINTVTGIVFSKTAGSNGIFNNITIRNVGITLQDNLNGAGIYLDNQCKLSGVTITGSNTWFTYNAGQNACGMYINGNLENGYVRFSTERLTDGSTYSINNATPNGYGIIMGSSGSLSGIIDFSHYRQCGFSTHNPSGATYNISKPDGTPLMIDHKKFTGTTAPSGFSNIICLNSQQLDSSGNIWKCPNAY